MKLEPLDTSITPTATHETENSLIAVADSERRWADNLGIGLSALCLLHCLMTPILLILLPSLQLVAYHESVHQILFYILPILAIGAFGPGYYRHRDARVFYWSVPALGLLMAGTFAASANVWAEILLTVAGSLLLIRAHLLNRKLCAEIKGATACGPNCGHQH